MPNKLLVADAILPRSMDDISGDETPARLRLLAIAEVVLGEEGLRGASLYRIARAAGQKNKYAVQYHFGGLSGLIDAVIRLRLKWVDRRRRELFDCARDRRLMNSVPALLEIIILPMAEQVDRDGRHSYARFWHQFVAHPVHPDDVSLRDEPASGPVDYVHCELARVLGIDLAEVGLRMHVIGGIVYSALLDRDNCLAMNMPVPPLDETIAGTINVMEAGLKAEVWPPLSSLWRVLLQRRFDRSDSYRRLARTNEHDVIAEGAGQGA